MPKARASPDKRWRAFFRDQYREDIQRLAESYPDDRSLYIDVLDLYEYDSNLTEDLFSEPEQTLARAAATLMDVHKGFRQVNVRVRNHPGLLSIENLRSRHIGELVAVEGTAAAVDPRQSQAVVAVFECTHCEGVTEEVPTGLVLESPAVCGSCNGTGSIQLRFDRSTFVDAQHVRVEDLSGEPTLTDRDPPGIDVFLTDDLVHTVDPEDTIVVTGIAKLHQDGSGNLFDLYLKAVSVSHDRAGPRRDVDEDLTAVIEERWRFAAGR